MFYFFGNTPKDLTEFTKQEGIMKKSKLDQVGVTQGNANKSFEY